MSFIRKKERVPVKGVPSLQLLLPKLPHPRAMLQQLTQLEIFPTIVQAAEERRILPLGKSRIHISYL
jgi:hypothetical protein